MPLSNKEKKRLYDMAYRERNREMLKVKKSIYYKSPAGKATAKRNREKLKQYHLKYCALPEQKEKTRKRDALRRHGDYRECYELTDKIIRFVRKYYSDIYSDPNVAKYERLKARGYRFNKAAQRLRMD